MNPKTTNSNYFSLPLHLIKSPHAKRLYWHILCVSFLSIASSIIFQTGSFEQKALAFGPPQINTPNEKQWAYPLAPDNKRFVPIEREYNKPPKNWLPGHRGVDFKAREGLKVISPTAGTVTFSGQVFGKGAVTVTDSQGYKISFEPVERKVSKGQKIKQGQLLGTVEPNIEASHCKPSLCVHWGVRDQNNEYQNPLFFLHSNQGSILLPHI